MLDYECSMQTQLEIRGNAKFERLTQKILLACHNYPLTWEQVFMLGLTCPYPNNCFCWA